MSDLRVPKHKVGAEVLLPGGVIRRMAFFLAEAAPDHDGPERPLDLLNGDADFLPAFDEESAAMAFLHRKGVGMVRVDRAHDADDEAATLPTEHEVDVRFGDGTEQRGLISFVRPPDHSRLADFLNEPTPFFRLLQGAQVAYVNKRHVALVALHVPLTMARLDAIIEVLLSDPKGELTFETGRGATLTTPRGRQLPIKQALTTQQIVGAMAEIVPDDLRDGFPQPGPTIFNYLSPRGAVEIRFELDGAVARARVLPLDAGRAIPAGAALPLDLQLPDPAPRPAASAAAAVAPPPPPEPPAPVIKIPAPADPRAALDALLDGMVTRRASDLHLASDSPPMLRIDGDMTAVTSYGPLGPDRLKELLWSVTPEKNREEWHAKKDTDFAHETAQARFRVNVFCDRKGIGAVLRQIPTEILTAEKMGLSQAVLDLCFLNKGLVLVTGPTGSGKSTTLAAMIDYINRHRDDHIITIEDPIEFVHPSRRCLVNQREVGVHTSGFKAALRAALREDPDVVLVGELRDLETIAIAIETAETGHLVFGTLHTNTAPSTVDRIIDQFPADRQSQIRMMLSESLKGVIAQVLCKKIGGGRAPALEILLCSSGVANLIREGKTFQIPSMMQTGRAQGMVTLNDSLIDLVKRKVVDPAEAWQKAVAKGEFKGLLERAGIKLEQPAVAGG